MPMHIAEINILDGGSSGPAAVWVIIDRTEYGGVFRNSEVGMS